MKKNDRKRVKPLFRGIVCLFVVSKVKSLVGDGLIRELFSANDTLTECDVDNSDGIVELNEKASLDSRCSKRIAN